jgi:hypothetical protein
MHRKYIEIPGLVPFLVVIELKATLSNFDFEYNKIFMFKGEIWNTIIVELKLISAGLFFLDHLVYERTHLLPSSSYWAHLLRI